MNNISKAFFIGFVAGIIDAVPMIFQGLDWYASLSAFVHWVVLGLIIPFVKWNMPSWLKGLLIGELAGLPIMIIVFKAEPFSLIPIALFSAVLGVLVGITGAKFIKIE
jgi:hypothetical protein